MPDGEASATEISHPAAPGGALLQDHKSLLWGAIGGGVVINIPLNGALTRLTFPPVPLLPLLARGPCVLFDTLGTSLSLPLITCLLLTAVVRRLVRSGAMPRATPTGLVARLPGSAFLRGLLLGALALLFVGLPTVAALAVVGVEALGLGAMVAYKVVFSVALGTLITPPIVLAALGDA